MIDLQQIQKDVFANKAAKGFNTTNVNLEFNLLYGEVAEACDAYRKKRDDLGEELADVAIYLLGIAEICGVNLEEEIVKKVEKNRTREYKKEHGAFVKSERNL